MANAYTANAEVFTKFMDVHTNQMQAASDMLSKATPAPVAAPVPVVEPVKAVSAKPAADMYGIITEAIADKTGYPTDMIDEDMELEADLGIDSIKRVEIFAEVLKKLGITLTHDQTEELSTMSTVEAISAYLSKLV